MKHGLSLLLGVCLVAGAALLLLPIRCKAEIVVDIGTDSSKYRRGSGWRNQKETNRSNTFCWIDGIEADLYLELAEPEDCQIAIFARPYYYDNCRQRFALFVNNRYIDEWTCFHHPEWVFKPYRTVIPESAVHRGTNHLVFRMSYASEIGSRGLSLAVSRIVLSPKSQPCDPPPDTAWISAALAILLLATVFVIPARLCVGNKRN